MSALRKVLVVDDDEAVAKSVDRVLTQKGCAVITAHDAREALERLRREEVDLVFTDIRMPGMDGLELAEKMKQRRPWTPVVIVTGHGTPAAEERARAAGVSGFLHKPLSPEAIEDSAASALLTAPLAAQIAGTAPSALEPAAAIEATAPTVARRNVAKDLVLFALAPFIGLAYAVCLPFVGLGMVGWMGAKALAERMRMHALAEALRAVGGAAAAPFVGLAYIALLPFVGLAALAWFGWQALAGRGRTVR
jgi:CheY-like chemotaxis protein